MFEINGSRKYKVTYIKGGRGQKSEYTFITIEGDLIEGQRYPDKLKINIWGENLESKIKKGDFIKILGANRVGIDSFQDKNDPNKWYKTLKIECGIGDIQTTGGESEKKVETVTEIEPIADDVQLPF